jgi:hypothetical protein
MIGIETKKGTEMMNISDNIMEVDCEPISSASYKNEKYLWKQLEDVRYEREEWKACCGRRYKEVAELKNRIEDFYNLSLSVKDIKSMGASLQKLIEGETINDYECETCKKKVDISKRILLS